MTVPARVLLFMMLSSSIPTLLYMAMRLLETGRFVLHSLKPLFLAILKYDLAPTAPAVAAHTLQLLA